MAVPLLSKRDYDLSMRLSARAKSGENGPSRSQLLHRLPDALMAVWRKALSRDGGAVHCEPCGRWFRTSPSADEVTCPFCLRVYAVELVIYRCVSEGETVAS